MKEKRITIILWITGLLVFAIGIAYSVATYSACVEGKERLKRKVKEYGELKQLEKKIARYDAALELFEQIESKEISNLKKSMQAKFPNCNPEDIRENRQEGIDGWIIRDVEAALNDVVLSDVMSLAVGAESMRPPWVLTKCVLTASPRIDSCGNAVLTFTGVTR